MGQKWRHEQTEPNPQPRRGDVMARIPQDTCALCGARDEAGNGRWACLSDLDTTTVCKGKCFLKYTSDRDRLALARRRGGVFLAIDKERERQESLWGAGPMPAGKEMTILIEEVGEVARAQQGDGNIIEELTQVAAVCVRWIETLTKPTTATGGW